MLSMEATRNSQDEVGNSGLEFCFLVSHGEARLLVDGKALRNLSPRTAEANSILEEKWVRLQRWSKGGSACPPGQSGCGETSPRRPSPCPPTSNAG